MSTLSWLIDDSFSARLSVALLHFLWQGCCVGLLVWLGAGLLHNAPARLRYLFNLTCLLLMATCLPATFLLISDRAEAPTPSSPTARIAFATTDVDPSHVQPGPAPITATPTDVRRVAAAPVSESGSASAESSVDRMPGITITDRVRSYLSKGISSDGPALSRWIARLYLAGVCCILARLVFGMRGGQRLRTMAVPVEDVALLQSLRMLASRVGLKVVPAIAWCEQISVPVVVGIMKPMILLPLTVVSNLTTDQVQALLLHELAHIRRYDPIVNLLQRIVEAVLFFHPVVWFVSRQVSIEREHAADDMVLAAGWERPLYADALLRMAELAAVVSGRAGTAPSGALAAAGSSPSEFKLRILRLLDASRPPKFAVSRGGVMVVLALIFATGVFAWSQAQPPARTTETKDKAASTDSLPLPKDMNLPQETAPPKGLEFLKPYPALHGLSLDMSETQFVKLIEQQKLTTHKTIEGEKIQHQLALGDGHTLIVMFDEAGENCRGIQRVRGEEAAGAVRVLRTPSLLLPDHWVVLSVGFDHDEKELVTASTQGFVTIRRWDLVAKKLISEIKLEADEHGRSFQSQTLTLSADRRRVIAATDAYVGIWETATGKLLTKLPITKVGDSDTVRVLSCTPDFSVIIGSLETNFDRTTLSYDAHTLVWDGTTGKLLRTLTHEGRNHFFALSLAADGKRFVTTHGGGATVWDTSNGRQLLEIANDNTGRKHPDPEVIPEAIRNVWSVQFSPDSKQVAMGDMLGVKIVDATSGKLLRQLEAPYRYSSDHSPKLVFSPDGLLLARLGTGDRSDKARTGYVVPIWSTKSSEKLLELQTEANDGVFSDDGQSFAVGFSDLQQALAVWSLDPNQREANMPAGPGPHSRQDRVEENGHYQGATAAEYIKKFQPIWGKAQQGIEYGIALTKPQQQFAPGERVPLVVFFRNISDKPLTIDMRPDYFGNTPKVVDANGAAIEFVNAPLLGHIAHYVQHLEPGDAVGPFYLSFGLGENPLPGKQHWHPYLKSPVAGKYQLTHEVELQVKEGDMATTTSLGTGIVSFEIVRDGQRAD